MVKRLFETKSERWGKYSKDSKVEVVKKAAEPKKKSSPKKDKK